MPIWQPVPSKAKPPGTVLITDYQSAGRGRQGRTWTAPPGSGIAMSILVRPEGIDPARWTWLSLLAGLAVSDGIRRTADLPAVLKWPNDVLVAERKVCGILSERVDTSLGAACVVGIGINVGLAEDQLPVPTATSLAIAAQRVRRHASLAYGGDRHCARGVRAPVRAVGGAGGE